MKPSEILSRARSYWREQPRILLVILLIFACVSLLYVGMVPSFEGPDESEHFRYVEAFAKGVKVHPLPPDTPREKTLTWGYQIHQPPLYYLLAAGAAKILRPTWITSLTVNRLQNKRHPHLRHDTPGETFPWSGVHLGLRKVRLVSWFLGLLGALLLVVLSADLFREDKWSRACFLVLVLLNPNYLQICSTVSNDSLLLFLCCAGALISVRLIRNPAEWCWYLALGGCVALAIVTKLSSFPFIVASGLLVVTLALKGAPAQSWRQRSLHVIAFAVLPLVIGGTFAAVNVSHYGDPFRQALPMMQCPATMRATPGTLLRTFVAIWGFWRTCLADLGWMTIRLEWASCCMFFLWLASLSWLAMGVMRPAKKEDRPIALWVGCVCCASVMFLYLVSRHVGTDQVRYFIPLLPMLAIPLVKAISHLRPRVVFHCLLPLLLAVNAWAATRYMALRQPCADTSQDRDYHIYIYAVHADLQPGLHYLHRGTFYPFDFLEHFENRDWEACIASIEDPRNRPYIDPQHLQYYALAKHNAGDTGKALRVCEELVKRLPSAAPTHVRILADRDRVAALATAEKYLASAKGESQSALLKLIKELRKEGEGEK